MPERVLEAVEDESGFRGDDLSPVGDGVRSVRSLEDLRRGS